MKGFICIMSMLILSGCGGAQVERLNLRDPRLPIEARRWLADAEDEVVIARARMEMGQAEVEAQKSHRAGLEAGQRVAVVGGGAIGLCAVAVARAASAAVGLSARYDHQVAAGKSLGAGEVEGQYDLVVECAGTEKAVSRAIKLCRPKGKVLILGTHWNGLPLQQIPVMMKEITIVSSFMYASNGYVRDSDVAAALLSRHPEIAKAVISHRFPLAEAKHAFAVARDRKAGAIKVVLEP